MRELVILSLLGLPLLGACGGGGGGSDAAVDGAVDGAADGTPPGDAAPPDSAVPPDSCVPSCGGRSCGDDGCGDICGTCGDGLACDSAAGTCGPASCEAGCTTGCDQGCFDLGDCTAGENGLDLHANVQTIGVVMPGGAEGTAVYYRPATGGNWWQAVPLADLPDGSGATSLFGLASVTEYEVRVGDAACGRVTTQPVDPVHETTETLWVDASAAAGGDGSEGSPFVTIQSAVDAASSGTDVRVRAGVYREEVDVSGSGTAGRYLRILGEDGAILDGADASVVNDGLPWTSPSANVYQAAWGGDPSYLDRDGLRSYHYVSLDGLRAGIGDDGEEIAEGWFVEGGQLYVRSLDDPASHVWQVPALSVAVALDGVSFVWVEGFEIRFYGEGEFPKGVDVRASDDVVVRGNHIHETPSAVWVRRGSDGVRVENNVIHQSVVPTWPWPAVKGTDHENTAIQAHGGRGAIVRGNTIHTIFNGITAGSFSDDRNPAISYDVDVYENRFSDIGDDAVEPEGACINNRFRSNVADRLHNGASLAPITFGPTWVLRNRFTRYDESGFKVSNDSSGRVYLFHNTSWTDVPGNNGMNVSGPFQNMVFRNNIVRGEHFALEISRMLPGENDLDYDNWFTTRSDGPHFKWDDVRYDDMAAWCAATGLECNGQPNAPMLEDPAAARFALTAGSPNIDAAERIFGINDGFAGAGPDIGYLELGAAEVPAL